MTFQSMDDMSDKMTGDEDFGKSIGKDLEEGKIMPTNQPPRSKLSKYEMNIVISQQAAENSLSSRASGIKVICRIKPGSHDA